MGHGGKRKGAGRKSNADIARARGLIGAVIPDARWKEIVEKLAQLTTTRTDRTAVEAFRALALYSFGVPTEKNSSEEEKKPVSVIRIIDPHENDPDPDDEPGTAQDGR